MNTATTTSTKPKIFAQRTQALRSTMNDADCGPLVVAEEVVSIVDNWIDHKVDAGGVEAETWLFRTFGSGRSLAWFRRRREAVLKLGEAVRRTIHHDVAAWIVARVAEKDWKRVKLLLMQARKNNGDNPVSLGRARILVQKELKTEKKKRACAACAKKDALIKRLQEQLATAGTSVDR